MHILMAFFGHLQSVSLKMEMRASLCALMHRTKAGRGGRMRQLVPLRSRRSRLMVSLKASRCCSKLLPASHSMQLLDIAKAACWLPC